MRPKGREDTYEKGRKLGLYYMKVVEGEDSLPYILI